MKDVFTDIYHTNYWNDKESVSGRGSNLKQTEGIREQLPDVFEQLDIYSLLDIPCGDYHWGAKMIWPHEYIGADIVPEIIKENKKQFPQKDWRVLDATKDELPKVDLILCRDMLGHFSNYEVRLALKNFRASGSTYLLATTFPDRENNGDIKTGEWRPINLASMFGLSNPILLIDEQNTEGDGSYSDKCLGLWKINGDYA